MVCLRSGPTNCVQSRSKIRCKNVCVFSRASDESFGVCVRADFSKCARVYGTCVTSRGVMRVCVCFACLNDGLCVCVPICLLELCSTCWKYAAPQRRYIHLSFETSNLTPFSAVVRLCIGLWKTVFSIILIMTQDFSLTRDVILRAMGIARYFWCNRYSATTSDLMGGLGVAVVIRASSTSCCASNTTWVVGKYTYTRTPYKHIFKHTRKAIEHTLAHTKHLQCERRSKLETVCAGAKFARKYSKRWLVLECFFSSHLLVW